MKKNTNSKQTLAVFSAATDLKYKIVNKLHRKGLNKILTELSLLRQGPTFKQIYLINASFIVLDLI